ncbi:MAG: hypothetical protein RI894_613, partial [Bacteroidota bacterium]
KETMRDKKETMRDKKETMRDKKETMRDKKGYGKGNVFLKKMNNFYSLENAYTLRKQNKGQVYRIGDKLNTVKEVDVEGQKNVLMVAYS